MYSTVQESLESLESKKQSGTQQVVHSLSNKPDQRYPHSLL